MRSEATLLSILDQYAASSRASVGLLATPMASPLTSTSHSLSARRIRTVMAHAPDVSLPRIVVRGIKAIANQYLRETPSLLTTFFSPSQRCLRADGIFGVR